MTSFSVYYIPAQFALSYFNVQDHVYSDSTTRSPSHLRPNTSACVFQRTLHYQTSQHNNETPLVRTHITVQLQTKTRKQVVNALPQIIRASQHDTRKINISSASSPCAADQTHQLD